MIYTPYTIIKTVKKHEEKLSVIKNDRRKFYRNWAKTGHIGLGGGGGKGWVEATVVRGVLYPDATRDPLIAPVEGYSAYILRLTSDVLAAWLPGTTYTIGDAVVALDGRKYTSLVIENKGNDPQVSPIQWYLEPEISPKVRNYETILDMRQFLPFYKTGETVLLYTYASVYYFMNRMFCVADTDLSGSLRWNETERRLMAVFK